MNDAWTFTTRCSSGCRDCFRHARESRSGSSSITRAASHRTTGFQKRPSSGSSGSPLRGVLFPPGTSSAYSNSDFVLLGLIVEKVTGRPLDQVVTSRIIRRLHLRGTSYGTEHAQRMTPWLGPVESFGRPVSGDGGIISTVEDVATFFRALLGGNLLAPKQLAEMTGTIATDRPDLRYGLGIWRYRLPCGFAWGHGGLASYQVDVEVARDGSKAVVWAVNNPAPSDWSFGDRLYCA